MTTVHDTTRPGGAPEFDPFSGSFLSDPYPWFARYREQHPVFYSEDLGYWVLSRYHDVRTALRESSLYSAENTLDPIQPLSPRTQEVLREGGFRPIPTLTNTDPPRHTRGRRIATAAFTPRRVAQMEGFVRELVGRFVDERLREGRADIVAALTFELPALVILKVLGVPDEDVPEVKAGSERRVEFVWGRQSEEDQVRMAEGLAAFWRYTENLAESRKREPKDDFTSDILRAKDADGQTLTHQEACTILFGLLVAGHETTTNLIGNALRCFLAHGDTWKQLGDDPSLIPGAIEEVLRYDSSVLAARRRTKAAVRVDDVEIPGDAGVLLLLAAANRDPEVFDDPDVFDIRRPNAKDHLSFGNGPHLCLGAPLARLEARVVFEELTTRLPSLRLVPDQKISYHPNVSFRGPLSLHVEWDARDDRR